MEYEVIKADTTSALNKAVNKMIGEGWNPIGGVSISIGGQYNQYFIASQAMIREVVGGGYADI